MRRVLAALVVGCGAAWAAAATQDDPTTPEGWERRGHELRALADREGERGRLAEAERAFDRAIETGGETPLRCVARGIVRRLLGEGAQDPVHRRIYEAGASADLARAIELAQAQAGAPKVLADVLRLADRPTEALPLYAALLRDAPPDAPTGLVDELRLGLRACADAVGPAGAGAAAAHVEALLAAGLGLRCPALVQDLHTLRLREGDAAWGAAGGRTDDAAIALYVAAGQAYVAALRASGGGADDPAFARAYRGIALTLVTRGRRPEGVALLRALETVLPTGLARAEVRMSLAIEHKDAGEPDPAIAAYAGALDDLPAGPATAALRAKALGDLALVHFGAALRKPAPYDLRDARACFEACIREAPPGDRYAVFAAENLARVAEHEARPAEARRHLHRALDAAAQLPDLRDRLDHTARVLMLMRWIGAGTLSGNPGATAGKGA